MEVMTVIFVVLHSVATLIYVAIPLIACLPLLCTSLIVDGVSRRHHMITGYGGTGRVFHHTFVWHGDIQPSSFTPLFLTELIEERSFLLDGKGEGTILPMDALRRWLSNQP